MFQCKQKKSQEGSEINQRKCLVLALQQQATQEERRCLD